MSKVLITEESYIICANQARKTGLEINKQNSAAMTPLCMWRKKIVHLHKCGNKGVQKVWLLRYVCFVNHNPTRVKLVNLQCICLYVSMVV